MLNYKETVQAFDLQSTATQMLSGSVNALNACYECCDRHAHDDKIRLVLARQRWS